jgi:hypothetical protein
MRCNANVGTRITLYSMQENRGLGKLFDIYSRGYIANHGTQGTESCSLVFGMSLQLKNDTLKIL